jgi:hypothetical protein
MKVTIDFDYYVYIHNAWQAATNEPTQWDSWEWRNIHYIFCQLKCDALKYYTQQSEKQKPDNHVKWASYLNQCVNLWVFLALLPIFSKIIIKIRHREL